MPFAAPFVGVVLTSSIVSLWYFTRWEPPVTTYASFGASTAAALSILSSDIFTASKLAGVLMTVSPVISSCEPPPMI